jgi:hypothetical protein
MKKILSAIFLIVIVFLLFKLKSPRPPEYLVRINNYSITPQEFIEEFKLSAYVKNNTPESKREFLNMLIRRKLILQEAQAKGLDKDPEFLKSIERFWEQSLLKRMMDKKFQEIQGSILVSDKAVEAIYNKLKSEGKADKPYDQMYKQLKWSLTQLQESQAINKWLTELYKKSQIKINPDYVTKEKQNKTAAGLPAPEFEKIASGKDLKLPSPAK